MTDHPQEGENNLLNKSLAECPKMAHKLKQEQGLQRKEGGAPPEFIQVSVQYTGHGLAVGAGRKVKGERERGGAEIRNPFRSCFEEAGRRYKFLRNTKSHGSQGSRLNPLAQSKRLMVEGEKNDRMQ